MKIAHFRNKNKEYLEAIIDELETNSKIKNIRDLYRSISHFKEGYKPRTNIVKDEKGGRTISTQLLNAHGVNDVRLTEIHTAELLLPEPSAFKVKMATEKLTRHKHT
jgi:C4-type Zn-finger protein